MTGEFGMKIELTSLSSLAMELEDIHSTRQDRASCRALYQPVIITFLW